VPTEPTTGDDSRHWEQHATDWITWVRRPGFDSYWRYRDAFFELVPPPGTATLDLGCGEGRVSRDLKARGHRVVGVDAAPTMVAAAREADPDGDYRHIGAADLPFADGEFDLVVAYNTLMDIEDLAGAMREATRVLAPGGRLCVAITHPLTNAGSPVGTGAERTVLLDRPYFQTRRFTESASRDGLTMLFHGWDRPLTAYTRPLEDAGLLIESIREPVATAADGATQRLPFHLWFRAMRPR
jgi:SAM-dependent methyltransferase